MNLVTHSSISATRWAEAVACSCLLIAAVGCGSAAETESQESIAVDAVSASREAVFAVNSQKRAAPDLSLIEAKPFGARAHQPDEKRFEMLDPQSIGVDFMHKWTRRAGQLRNNTTGCGVCMGDYDGDGFVDVFLPRSTDGGKLYRNLGEWKFQDVTDDVGIGGDDRWTTGATFVDIDDDGDLDLYVCGFDCPNHLYINQGDGKFVERGEQYGLDYEGSSAMMAFADYDRDGDLDAYLLTNHIPPDEEIEYNMQFDRRGVPSVPSQYRQYHDLIRLPDGSYGVIESGQYDHLYRNEGNGTFVEVTEEAGIDGNHKGLSATWWDYNDDGWPDLYVANDFYGPDSLYRNNGDGTFTDAAADVLPHTPWFSMGSDLGDINNDGLPDFMGTDMSATSHYRKNVTMGDIQDDGWFLEVPMPRQYMRNAVYIATGMERVWEVAYLMGLESTDWTWSARFVDLDQDGKLDLHVTNGMSRDWGNSDLKAAAMKLGPTNSDAYNAFWDEQPPLKEANFAFKNQGDFRLDDVSTDWGLGHIGVSFGAAFGDLDRDGDLDLVVNNFDEAVTVYRNNGADGAAIKVRLLGSQSNRWGIGAKVSIKVGDQMQVRYLTLSRGFMSASDPTVHFGVGEAKAIDELVVDWPSGHRQSFVNLDVNTVYVITEPASNGKPQVETPPQPLFVQVDKFKSITDKQQPFDDFRRQPLLPHRLSQMGPGLASGDINDDGLADLFFGAAKGGWGWLERNKGDGVWKADNDLFPAWSDAEGSEDMGVLFLDADGDGDQDLFVASGGIEAEPGQAELRDRLYLNDGTGDFELASDRLPEISSSSGVVAAADFDRDGDLDLFVGGRTVPGSYPESPPSQLLMNEKGQFSDAVAENCPALAKTGMVTGVLWSDYDGDGWLDLWVTHEWGPIRVFRNIEGKLHEETESTGLMNQHGMWNGIAGRDVDGDGDIDYVATNLGRNTMYRATQGNPYKLLYGDFSGEGRNSVVEAYDNAPGKLVPLRSRHLLSQAMPFIEAAYPTYHDYATATVAEMFTQDALDKATILELNQVNNVLLRNNGAGQFTLENLTVLAQFAPGFGVVLDDFNADGYSDAIIVQNSYAPRRETGRMDGGMGLMLAGDGAGNLEAVSPMKSGLVIPGDAKSLVVTDLDGNGWQDLVVGITDEPVMVFENQGVEGRKLVHVQLKGTKGNPTAVGARVTLLRSDGVQQAAEIYAGSGYLSQSASDLYFGLGADAAAESIIVQWPDGQVSEHVPQAGEYKIELSHPTADRKAAAEL